MSPRPAPTPRFFFHTRLQARLLLRLTASAAAIGVAASVFAPSALAGGVEKAEHVRVSEEMRKLAQRNAWSAVEAQFQKLIALQTAGEILTVAELGLGIQAAQNLGDITAARSRLSQAIKIEVNPDFQAQLAAIDANYGHVTVAYDARYGADRTIIPAAPPFAPDQRASISIANTAVLSEQDFDGLLPAGDYTVGSTVFVVAAGKDTGSVAITPAEGEGRAFQFGWMGPRASVGVSALVAGELNTHGTAADAGLQATHFGGVGARIGVGVDVGLTDKLGVLAEVGYHDLFGSERIDGEAVTNPDGSTVQGNSIHLGYGWLAGSLRVGKFWAAAGPIWGVGGGSITGADGFCVSNPTDAACVDSAGLGEENARFQRLSGKIMAGGAAASVSYALFDVGPFSGAVSLTGGAQTDSYRLYPWGEAGLTFAPITKTD